MANHTHDCEFCGQDQRMCNTNPGSNYCCERQEAKEKAEEEARIKKDKRLFHLKSIFGLEYGEFSLLSFLEYLYEHREMLPLGLRAKIEDREKEKQKRATCTHKNPDGTSAWEDDGGSGFMCSFYTCKLCGDTDCDL